MTCPWCGSVRIEGRPSPTSPQFHRCEECCKLFHSYPGGEVSYFKKAPPL